MIRLENELFEMKQNSNQLVIENEKKDQLLEAYQIYMENLEKEKNEMMSILQRTEAVITSITGIEYDA